MIPINEFAFMSKSFSHLQLMKFVFLFRNILFSHFITLC